MATGSLVLHRRFLDYFQYYFQNISILGDTILLWRSALSWRRTSVTSGAPTSTDDFSQFACSTERTQDEVLVGLILLPWLSLQGSEPVRLQHFKMLFLAVENPVNGFSYS